MKNLWVQLDSAVAVWHAEVTSLARDTSALRALIRSVYEAGARTGMLIPIGFDPEAVMTQRWNDDTTVDLFWTRSESVPAELWWFDRGESIVHRTIEDVRRLLDSRQPAAGTIT